VVHIKSDKINKNLEILAITREVLTGKRSLPGAPAALRLPIHTLVICLAIPPNQLSVTVVASLREFPI
jgi:hypothetical protein